MGLDLLLPVVIAPVATLSVVMLVGNLLWRLSERRQVDLLPALACGVALTAGFIAMFDWPGLPPGEFWQWTMVLIWVATVAAWVGLWLESLTIVRLLFWALTATASAWLVFPPFEDYESRRTWWIGGVALLIFANLEATSHLNRKQHDLFPLFMLTLGTILCSIVVGLNHSAKLAQTCGAVAAVLGFLFLICLRLRSREPVAGASVFPSILVPALSFLAFFYDSDGETFPTAVVLASITPLMVAAVTLSPIFRRKVWKRFVVAQIVCIIPVAIGIMLLMRETGVEESYSY